MTSKWIKALNLSTLYRFAKPHRATKIKFYKSDFSSLISDSLIIIAFVVLITSLNPSYSDINTISSEAVTEPTTETGIIDLGPDTKWVRDVEVVQGTLNKKTTIVVHILNVTTPGSLDVAITFNGKHTPIASISGLNFNGSSGSFMVEPASYVLTIRSTSGSNTGYVATITYPEREVPIDIPLGYQEVITYNEDSDLLWYIYLVLTLVIFIFTFILYKKGKLTITK